MDQGNKKCTIPKMCIFDVVPQSFWLMVMVEVPCSFLSISRKYSFFDLYTLEIIKYLELKMGKF